MKIIFIGCRNITKIGGIENYMSNLTTNLIKAGYSCVVYCESDGKRHENLSGVDVMYWKGFRSNLLTKPVLSFVSTVHALIHHRDASVFHYNTWAASLFCWLPRLFGKQVILQGHGFEWQRTKYSLRARKIHHAMEWLTAKMAQHLTMVSEEQTAYFKEHYGRTPVTIPCAVNIQPKLSGKIADPFLAKYGLTKGKYFFFLGRLIQDKNPDYLIDAYLKNPALPPDFKLCLAGDIQTQTKYGKKLLQMTAGRNDVILTGPIYGSEKIALLQNCGCFCLPSSMEGLPICMLEAMEAGVPIICSDIPACVEAVAENAFFAKQEDSAALQNAMERFLHSSAEEIQSMIRRNRERLDQFFTWSAVVKKYIAFLEEICHCCPGKNQQIKSPKRSG